MAGESSLVKALLQNLSKQRPDAMKRARAMGFDTKNVFFHGTDQPINEFNPEVYVAKDPEIAEVYARKREYGPVQLDFFKPNPSPNLIPMFAQKGSPELTNQMAGYYKIFDPRHLRSVFADFNPEHAESVDIMKSNGGSAKSPAWTRKEGKNPEGGLNEKGRASLRAAGHDIKRPQPEGGSRKDSFCARMKGMKEKLTSSETANDPDSRINKSLRKWNCRADGGAIDAAMDVVEEYNKRKKTDKNFKPGVDYRYGPKDPMFYISPEEYQRGNLKKGNYALASGGRANMATGGEPEKLSPNEQYISSLYQNVLGRQADQPGLAGWAKDLGEGYLDQGDILTQFAQSPEFQNLYKADPSRAVSSLYQSALGRAPEQAGLEGWVNSAKGGMSLSDMTQAFLNSQEGQNVLGIGQMYQDYTGNVATPEQVKQSQQLLGQNPDWNAFLEKTFPTTSDEGSYDVAGKNWVSKATPVPGSSAELVEKLGPIERQYGLAPGTLLGMMGIESQYGTNQQRKGSKYSGAFQLSPTLQRQYGVKNPYDWVESANAAAQYAKQNADVFKAATGRNPTAAQNYGLYQQGGYGFSGIAARPDMTAAQALRASAPRKYKTDAKAIRAIRGNLPDYLRKQAGTMTGRDFMDYYTNKFTDMLAGPDKLGQQAIADYYKNYPEVQTASAPAPATPAQPVDIRIINEMERLAQAGAGGGVYQGGLPIFAGAGSAGGIPSTGYVNPVPMPGLAPLPATFNPPPPVDIYQQTFQDLAARGASGGMGGFGGMGTGLFGTGGTGAVGSGVGGGGMVGSGGFGVGFRKRGGRVGGMSTKSLENAKDVIGHYKSGGPVWDKPRPKSLGKPEALTSGQKASAKASAKAAGRPYPNLVDNMRAAKKD